MKILRYILAIVLGWMLGSFVNMAIVKLGHSIYPIPNVDVNNWEALAAAMQDLSIEYFIFPFLAHALGTLCGAFLAALLAPNNKLFFALCIGALFLIGGITVNIMLSSPILFFIVDVLFAYIPMAWLGGKLAVKIQTPSKTAAA